MGRVESGNRQGRDVAPELLFPGFENLLVRILVKRSAFVRAQVELQSDNQCVQLPPELGHAWLESLLLAYQGFRAVEDHVKFTQFIKVRVLLDSEGERLLL